MARDKAKLGDILLAVVARLISEMPNDEFNANNCYLALDPDELPEPGLGGDILVVSPTSEEFQGPMFEGGGAEQATTMENIIVIKLHSSVQLDEPHRSTVWLTGVAVGVCEKMRQVFKAMTNGFDPVDKDGNEMLRDPFSPGGYTFMRSPNRCGAVEMRFRYMFDWDLS